MSGGVHLRGLPPVQHSSEETSQRRRAVGNTVPIWPALDLNRRPSVPNACALTAAQTFRTECVCAYKQLS